MPERPWSTLTAAGLCHLVVVEGRASGAAAGDATPADTRAAELKSLLDVLKADGDHAINWGGSPSGEHQTCVAFTSFADAERFAAVLHDVRPVRQIAARWSSQWDGVYDKAALVRLRGELRRLRRPLQRPPMPARHSSAA